MSLQIHWSLWLLTSNAKKTQIFNNYSQPLRSCSCLARRPWYFLSAFSWSLLREPFSGANSRKQKKKISIKEKILHKPHKTVQERKQISSSTRGGKRQLLKLKGYKPCFSCAAPRATHQTSSAHVPPRSCTTLLSYSDSPQRETERNCGTRSREVKQSWKCITLFMWVCACVCVLPGEAEEDVNDDGGQVYTLFPVLSQYSGQGTQSGFCMDTQPFLC